MTNTERSMKKKRKGWVILFFHFFLFKYNQDTYVSHQKRKNVQFEQEARLCIGVFMRQKLKEDGREGELEGVRLPFYDYTNKKLYQ